METIQITQQETKLKVGDVLVYSWGYDQTNIDFFKIVGLTKTMVKIRQLKSVVTETGFMCGNSIPTNEFKSDEVIRKKPYYYEGRPQLGFSYGLCELWNGKPKGCSWYA